MITKDWIALVASLMLCAFVGVAGSWFSREALADWYPVLRKPELNPPNWLFAPVWTILYLVMGLAAWIVWRAFPAPHVVGALLIFVAQLALNFFWSVIFFHWRRPDAAFVDLLMMWLAIVATIIAFAAVSPLAAALLVPYLAWVTFAGYLNGGIWRLNRPPSAVM